MSEQDYEQLTLFPVDSRASPSVQPGSAEAVRMTVTSGQRCSELLRKSSPLGLLVKMLLESSTWHSTLCWLIWNYKATKQGRLYFQLVASTPRIEDTECALWPTPISRDWKGPQGQSYAGKARDLPSAVLWPTPAARDCKGANSMEHLQREGKRNHADQLANAVKLWPTVTASDYRARGPNSHQQGLPEAVRMWPTPTSRSGTGSSQTETRQGGMDLQTAAALWPTPTVTGNYNHPGSGPKAGMGLATAAKLYPTPTQFDATCGDIKGKEYNGQTQHAMKLIQAAKLYPTPTTGAGLCGGTGNYQQLKALEADGTISAEERRSMAAGNGGQLNPEWVEAMMGFPIGWTASEPDGQTEAGNSESPA